MSESLNQPEFMPDMLQSGTLNAPAIIAARQSVELIIKETPKAIAEREKEMAIRLIERLKNIKGVSVYGLDKGKRNGTVAFNIDKLDSVRAAEILNDSYKICTRGGWHCAYPAHEALGTQQSGAVRASFGYFNSNKDADRLAMAVSDMTKKVRSGVI